MNDDGWLPVMKDSDLKAQTPAAVFPKGLPVLLVRHEGGEIYAVANKCAHMGCPLAAGKLDGHILQCPCHDWRFDIRDGKFLDAPELAVKTYPAEIEDGKIFLRIP